MIHFQCPGHSSYSLTFQTRACTLCSGDTFETQLPPSGRSCLPWISFCPDRPSSLTSCLWGRNETRIIRLSERKKNYNILRHFHCPVVWVREIDQILQKCRLNFYFLMEIKGRQRKGKQMEWEGVHCPGVLLWSQNWESRYGVREIESKLLSS